MRRTAFLVGVLVITILSTGACKSTPPEIPEGLSREELFQRAQEAVDRGDEQTALLYYQTVLERYPDDLEGRAAAEYEIAHIYYKQGLYGEAKELFLTILSYYDTQEGTSLPLWIKVLSEKHLSWIQEKEAEQEAQGS
ncbi:hypothetical protein Spith_0175 [Spirochaeta thermophila DSM 6578]|uniref:Uncharacterized protein n=1 Tax=Winmispira thermophila (strain ATCC 700085 / DSM 6578 / Z-1203) TaxID=869211 RepID=G0GCP3_WINT7|nr:tetratricopeptide repeat protein [Spirochaeta thermophila]AEJ60462.1 hypothetical protein Spith_0175 [Spirochaeta thermophila DSM 6578]